MLKIPKSNGGVSSLQRTTNNSNKKQQNPKVFKKNLLTLPSIKVTLTWSVPSLDTGALASVG